ncbi:MAG: hypothetical protein R3Y61_01230 [Rikenellaceae bacterium]
MKTSSIYYMFAVALLYFFVGCQQDTLGVDDDFDTTKAVGISFTAEDCFSDISVTRARDGDVIVEDRITDMWLMFFDSQGDRIEPSVDSYGNDVTGRQGRTEDEEIFGSTYITDYEVGSTIWVNQKLSASIASIRVVCNIEEDKVKDIKSYYSEGEEYSENFTAEHCPTLIDFQGKFFRLEDNEYRESDMWYTYEDENFLRLAGSWDGVIPSTGLDFNLPVLARPMSAKVTISYSCEDYYPPEDGGVENGYYASITVSQVQIIHVPQKCYFKDVNNAEMHVDHVYTSYQPYYSLTDSRLGYKTGEITSYVPQNMQGNVMENTCESDKSKNAPTYATKVVISATYKHFDEDALQFIEQPIYIEMYPGEAADGVESYQSYDIKMRRHFHIMCHITADKDAVSWETDYRVVMDESLPEGPIIRYEFRTDTLALNSAYDKNGNLLGDYPREDGSYTELLDTYRTAYNSGEWDDLSVYTLSPSYGYYDRYVYGYTGTTNIFADDDKPFLRNLALEEDNYDNYDNHTGKNHPEIFDVTFLKDNRNRYIDSPYDYDDTYSSGELKYSVGNNYINSSMLQLVTGWGTGIAPGDLSTEFTIVFIGSVGSNYSMPNTDRGVYYGNSIEWNKRWYFYRIGGTTATSSYGENAVTYGFAADLLIQIDALKAEPYQNVQSYDVCQNGQRKVYFNNVDVEAVTASGVTVPEYHSSGAMTTKRPSTTDYTFDAPMSIFGHVTSTNKDDCIDAKLRLFLVYDRALTLTEIDQIRRYASLHDLLIFGEEDLTGFDITVTENDYVGQTWDGETDWQDGGGGSATIE